MNTWTVRKKWLGALLCAAFLCGMARPSLAILDKTRFVAHLGIAYFCFHHWVSNPYREGKFVVGAPHRTASIVKAGAALLFAVREVKVSNKIAHESKDPTLQKVSGALDNVANSFTSVGQRFKSGKFASTDMDSLNSSFSQMDSSTRASKIEVKDKPVKLPGE